VKQWKLKVCLYFVSWIPVIQPTALLSLSQNDTLLSLSYAHREIRICLLLSDIRTKKSLYISFYTLDLRTTHATHLWWKYLKQKSKLPLLKPHSVSISPWSTNIYIQGIHFNWSLFLWKNNAKGRSKSQLSFPRGLEHLTIILCVFKHILSLAHH